MIDGRVVLQPVNGWRGIAIAGYFLAAWGYSSSGTLLYLCDIREPLRAVTHDSHYGIESLRGVAVSQKGVVALICDQMIKIITINDPIINTCLCAPPGHYFTDASFNDPGDLLFALISGRIKDSLCIWRCQDRVVNVETEWETHYEAVRRGYLGSRVIPHNTHQGCIIATEELFFPAQIRGRSQEILPRNHEVRLANVIAGCVFLDHSMITVERGPFSGRFRLKEYKIERQSLLPSTGVEICKLESRLDNPKRLLVVKEDENITVIVCNPNGTIEIVQIVPKPENDNSRKMLFHSLRLL